MKKQIRKWFAWLQEATSTENRALGRVFSDGRQLWATDGYRLHARQVALEKSGAVYLDADGLFQVREDGRVPELAAQMPPLLPTGNPVATVVVDRDALLQAVAGQDGQVQIALYGDDHPVTLSSAGAFALVMPVTGMESTDFWQPELYEQKKKRPP